jgi:TM2 domain-containing membrane protein YozV
MKNPPTDLDTESSSENFWPAFLLAIFLGVFGAHRFYLNSSKKFLMLFTFGGFGIWALIDVITILLGKFNDKSGQPIINPNPGASWAVFIILGLVGLAAIRRGHVVTL